MNFLRLLKPRRDRLAGMKSFRVLLLLFGSIGLPAGATPPAEGPASVTQGLYQAAIKHPGFSEESVKAYHPFVTPELFSRLWKEVTKPAPVGDANDIQFDVITGGQDAPTSFEIGQMSIDQTQAKVDVTVIFSPTEKHRFTVFLTKVDGSWKVDDIDYGPDGRLSKMLSESAR